MREKKYSKLSDTDKVQQKNCFSIRVGNPYLDPGSGIRPIFGQFWNPYPESVF